MSSKKAAVKKEEVKVEQKLSPKIIASNFIITIDKKKYSKKVTADEGELLFKKVALYNKRPNDKIKGFIIQSLTPKTIQETKKKEDSEVKIKALKKLANKENNIKSKEAASIKITIKDRVSKSTSEGKHLITYVNKGIAMVGFENIVMPNLLTFKIQEFLEANVSLMPLLNFWALCLLNPNEIARTRLFEYLSRHKFIITPSGYFVTYRMVKKTNNKDIFTDARTHTFKIKVGEVVSIPRSECDEDGSRDCSKGLHVGSPDFIGIEKGEGYNKETGQVGTGYIRQTSTGFGDQPIIAFVNPRHVVSIPNSETRKLRCCEYYPFKLTTPQEVISIEDSNYFIFEQDYKKLELKELISSIDREGLKEYLDGSKDSKRLASLKAAIDMEQMKLGKDTVAKSLSLEEIKGIVNSRLNVLKDVYPSAVQL